MKFLYSLVRQPNCRFVFQSVPKGPDDTPQDSVRTQQVEKTDPDVFAKGYQVHRTKAMEKFGERMVDVNDMPQMSPSEVFESLEYALELTRDFNPNNIDYAGNGSDNVVKAFQLMMYVINSYSSNPKYANQFGMMFGRGNIDGYVADSEGASNTMKTINQAHRLFGTLTEGDEYLSDEAMQKPQNPYVQPNYVLSKPLMDQIRAEARRILTENIDGIGEVINDDIEERMKDKTEVQVQIGIFGLALNEKQTADFMEEFGDLSWNELEGAGTWDAEDLNIFKHNAGQKIQYFLARELGESGLVDHALYQLRGWLKSSDGQEFKNGAPTGPRAKLGDSFKTLREYLEYKVNAEYYMAQNEGKAVGDDVA